MNGDGEIFHGEDYPDVRDEMMAGPFGDEVKTHVRTGQFSNGRSDQIALDLKLEGAELFSYGNTTMQFNADTGAYYIRDFFKDAVDTFNWIEKFDIEVPGGTTFDLNFDFKPI